MRSACKAAALILLSAFLAGCRHQAQATPPPEAQAPIVPVSALAKNTPPPQLPPPETPKVGPPAPASTTPPPKPKTHKIIHRKPKPEQTPADQARYQTTEQASNGAPGDVSPIGQIAAAGESINAPRRHQIQDEITSTEKGLNEIKRPLSQDEQTTAAQIRTFLAKAKDALTEEDLDGANTLVTKAKVLLTELTKS
jgi:hypothetical protein